MHNIKVNKTYSSDFEKVYPLLKEFNSPHTREIWNQIFSYHWDGAEDYVGYHLEHNNQVVGFMGLIFSCRYKNDIKYKFCNITSLIVQEHYRTHTLLLLRKLKLLEDTTCVVLSPIEESYRLFTMLGFIVHEKNYKIIPTANSIFSKRFKIGVYESNDLLNRVNTENKRLVIDHNAYNCKSILFDLIGKQCLLIYKITTQKHYSLSINKLHILHISDVTLFNRYINSILRVFNTKLGYLSALYINSHFIDKKHSLLSITKTVSPPKVLCNNIKNHSISIDEIYSEVVLL